MAQTYFITGAQGCIGSWIVKALAERGDSVVAFDRSEDNRRLSAIMAPEVLAQVRFVAGDITDVSAVRSALGESGARRIIHLAGLQVPTCKADPVAGAFVNVVGTLNVFESAKSLAAERVVYASSAAVFGAGDADSPLDESVAPSPLTHYGVFKRANEGNAQVYFLDHGLSSVGLRPLTVYGVNRDTGLTSDPTKAMKAAVLGAPFRIRFSGLTDFQYVADTAAVFIACADRAPSGAHVYNLHGETVHVARIAEIINRNSPDPKGGLVTFGGLPIPIAPALSDGAIRKVIPDLPNTPIETGISETMRLFADLRDADRLDTSDIDAELAAYQEQTG
jgi:nucleoside-diphosphate-sugar epimerase